MIRPAYAYAITNPTPFESIGSVVSTLLPNLIALAGLVTLLVLIFGGFKYITAGGDDKAITAAKHTITGAITGLIIIFCSWWIMRIVEIVLGIKIL